MINCLSKELFNHISIRDKSIELTDVPNAYLTDAQGNQIKCHGETNFNIQIGCFTIPIHAMVLNLPRKRPLILGQPFLIDNKAIINFETLTLAINTRQIDSKIIKLKNTDISYLKVLSSIDEAYKPLPTSTMSNTPTTNSSNHNRNININTILSLDRDEHRYIAAQVIRDAILMSRQLTEKQNLEGLSFGSTGKTKQHPDATLAEVVKEILHIKKLILEHTPYEIYDNLDLAEATKDMTVRDYKKILIEATSNPVNWDGILRCWITAAEIAIHIVSRNDINNSMIDKIIEWTTAFTLNNLSGWLKRNNLWAGLLKETKILRKHIYIQEHPDNLKASEVIQLINLNDITNIDLAQNTSTKEYKTYCQHKTKAAPGCITSIKAYCHPTPDGIYAFTPFLPNGECLPIACIAEVHNNNLTIHAFNQNTSSYVYFNTDERLGTLSPITYTPAEENIDDFINPDKSINNIEVNKIYTEQTPNDREIKNPEDERPPMKPPDDPMTTKSPPETKETDEYSIIIPTPHNHKVPIPVGHKGMKTSTLKRMKEVIKKYAHVFADCSSEIQTVKDFKYKIELSDKTIVTHKMPRLEPDKLIFAKKEVDNLIKAKVIKPSCSPYNFRTVIVKKPDGNYRLTIDLRDLNQKSRATSFPLPPIPQILDALYGKKVFSKLDLKSGYYAVSLDEDSMWLTAFAIDSIGKYEFTKLPMGLKGSSAAFLKFINGVLSGHLYTIANNFVDDLLIYTDDEEAHPDAVDKILDRLSTFRVMVNARKCEFAVKTTKFLGHILTEHGILPDPAKVQIINDAPAPANIHDIQIWSGLTGYYKRYIKDFATIMSPITHLLCGGVKFEWSEKCQSAFDKIKKIITSEPIVCAPDFRSNEPFILYTDGSSVGFGWVLSQVQNKIERVIEYGGRALSSVEKSKSATELEAAAALAAITKFHDMLADRHFILVSDHKSLEYILTNTHEKNNWADRKKIDLSAYTFEIKHRPGIDHGNADFLSRIPNLKNYSSDKFKSNGYADMITKPKICTCMQEREQCERFIGEINSIHKHKCCCCRHRDYHSIKGWKRKRKKRKKRRSANDPANFLKTSKNKKPKLPNIPTSLTAKNIKPIHEQIKAMTDFITRYIAATENTDINPRSYNNKPTPSDTFNKSINLELDSIALDQLTNLEVDDTIIRQEQAKDEICRNIMTYIKNDHSAFHKKDKDHRITELHAQGCKIINGILIKEATDCTGRNFERTFIPESMIESILHENHEDPFSGHMGTHKMEEGIRKHYFWPDQPYTIRRHVSNCTNCAEVKNNPNDKRNTMHAQNRSLLNKWEYVYTDIMGPINSKSDYKYIVSFMDARTRFVELVPMKKQDAVTVCKAFMERIGYRWGFPRHLLSDNGTQYTSSLLKCICEYTGITHHFSTPYYPLGNANIERNNRSISSSLFALCRSKRSRWAEFLPAIQCAYNRAISSVTGFAPHYMMVGDHFRLPSRNQIETPHMPTDNSSKEYMEALLAQKEIIEEKSALFELGSQDKQRRQYDKTSAPHTFKNGDIVYKCTLRPKKLRAKFEGPFIISEGNDCTFTLHDAKSGEKAGRHNVNRLKHFTGSLTRKTDFNNPFSNRINENYAQRISDEHRLNTPSTITSPPPNDPLKTIIEEAEEETKNATATTPTNNHLQESEQAVETQSEYTGTTPEEETTTNSTTTPINNTTIPLPEKKQTEDTKKEDIGTKPKTTSATPTTATRRSTRNINTTKSVNAISSYTPTTTAHHPYTTSNREITHSRKPLTYFYKTKNRIMYTGYITKATYHNEYGYIYSFTKDQQALETDILPEDIYDFWNRIDPFHTIYNFNLIQHG